MIREEIQTTKNTKGGSRAAPTMITATTHQGEQFHGESGQPHGVAPTKEGILGGEYFLKFLRIVVLL